MTANTVRQFSLSNLLGNQHLRYVPKTKLNFDYQSGDGPLCLLYEGKDLKGLQKFMPNLWKLVLPINFSAVYFASMIAGPQTSTFMYPLMFLPTYFSHRSGAKAKEQSIDQIRKMWLMKNGDQVVCQTYDGVMHKMNIVHNHKHEIQITKTKDLIFVMHNCKREFMLTNKDAKMFDYDLIDRVVKAVAIDTEKHQSLYHHLIYKQ